MSTLSGKTAARVAAALAVIAGIGLVMTAGPVPSTAAGRYKSPTLNNCLWELARGQGSQLVCDYPAWLADKERTELRRLTRERLQDAHCDVSIRIDRALVQRALRESNHTFVAPPQPVRCEIATRDTPIVIDATFAPRVVIKDGIAVDATPGLANVSGVNQVLAWPVVEYVNRSGTVRNEMLSMINGYLGMRVAHTQ